MNVWVVLYDEPDERADVLAVFRSRNEADAYADGEDPELSCLVVLGPLEVRAK